MHQHPAELMTIFQDGGGWYAGLLRRHPQRRLAEASSKASYVCIA